MMLAPSPKVLNALSLFQHEDKLIHFLVYGVLVWVFRWAVAGGASASPAQDPEVSTVSPSSDSPFHRPSPLAQKSPAGPEG
jgi:hypothetical protein